MDALYCDGHGDTWQLPRIRRQMCIGRRTKCLRRGLDGRLLLGAHDRALGSEVPSGVSVVMTAASLWPRQLQSSRNL
jgi:hypothetical protein